MPSVRASTARPGDPGPTRHGRRPWGVRLAALTAATALVAVLGLFAALYHAVLLPTLPTHRTAPPEALDLATRIYAADGRELARYYRENRIWIPYDGIAPAVEKALLATEDHRFYSHGGLDLYRLAAAAFETLRGRRQGASTLTMQLARNLYPEIGRAISVERKLREIATALKIEQRHTKPEIIEMYLNTVSFGNNAFGIEAAAQTYFNKHAGTLDVSESALLVGLLKGPTRYDPIRQRGAARQRRNVVLRRMARHGSLRPADLARLQREPVRLNVHRPTLPTSLAPYFAEYVRGEAEAWAARNGYELYTDGLRVYTTLDLHLQQQAQAAVDAQLHGLQAVAGYEWSRTAADVLGGDFDVYRRYQEEGRFEPFAYLWRSRHALVTGYVRQTARYRQAVAREADPAAVIARLRATPAFMDSLRAMHTRLETGLVALDPNSGQVKAWVGGRDFLRDQYDKVALARRQPGSTFKPFLYAAAIDRGYAPRTRVAAAPNRFSDPRTGISLQEGLTYSRNSVAASLMADLGPVEVVRMARRLGIRSPLTPVPSLALGTSEVTLLEMTSAYATLAARGQYHPPQVITRIEDRAGHVLATFTPPSRKALSMYTAHTVVDMLRGVVDRGTGVDIRRRFGIRADVAGKTGTTQHNADGWFILMHPNLVVGAWVGFNDPRIRFRSEHWGQGGHNALYVVGDFLKRALDEGDVRFPEATFRPPPGYREPEPLLAVGLDADTVFSHPAMFSPTRPSTVPGDALSQQDADVEQALRGVGRPDAYVDAARRPSRYDDAFAGQDADVEQALRNAPGAPDPGP